MVNLELTKPMVMMAKKTEEYFNAIRTNIQLSGSEYRTIVVTSVQPDEGKSTVSRNLAISFARSGYRTLLVDGDIRNSVLLGIFKPTQAIDGLTAYLSGNKELEEVISDTNVKMLDVIPAGQVALNPTNLLQNEQFRIMLEKTRQVYDYVIIDSSPIGLVIDAAIIAQQCDASIIVTKSGSVRRRFVEKAKEQMLQSNAHFLGVILNNIDETRDEYGSYGAYGQYGQYGQRSRSKRKFRPLIKG